MNLFDGMKIIIGPCGGMDSKIFDEYNYNSSEVNFDLECWLQNYIIGETDGGDTVWIKEEK